MEWLVTTIMCPLDVILVARLYASSYKIINECLV